MLSVPSAAVAAEHPNACSLGPPAPANRPAEAPAPADSGEYLTFRVGLEEYAIDILRVQEIRGHCAMTRIAHAPAHVKGVINLRGVIVPVVDLRLCLRTSDAGRDEDTVTIVLDLGERVMGTVVDAVSDVLSLQPSDIRPVPDVGRPAGSDAFLGIASVGAAELRRTLIVLDIERLIANANADGGL